MPSPYPIDRKISEMGSTTGLSGGDFMEISQEIAPFMYTSKKIAQKDLLHSLSGDISDLPAISSVFDNDIMHIAIQEISGGAYIPHKTTVGNHYKYVSDKLEPTFSGLSAAIDSNESELSAVSDTVDDLSAGVDDLSADVLGLTVIVDDLSASASNHSSNGSVDIELFDASDLDAYIVGDTWSFSSDINIITKNDITFDKAFYNNGATVNIDKHGFAGGTLTYTGTGALFRGIGDLTAVTNANIVLTGVGASLFDTDGVEVIVLDGVQVAFNPAGNQSIGVINGASRAITFSLTTFITYQSGLNITNSIAVGIRQCSFFSNTAGTSTSVRVDREVSTITMADVTFVLGPAESCVFIDPDVQGTAELITITNRNNVQFYEIGSLGSFTAIADNSVVIPEAINFVTNNLGQAVFNHSGGTLPIGQDLNINVGVPQYDGVYRIRESGPGTFETGVAYVSNAIGSYTTDSVTVTSTSHGLSAEQTILFENGADYYGGATVYDITPNTFNINREFVGTQTGNWSTSSLTEDDARISAQNVGTEANSRSRISYNFNGNGNTTVISDGAYVDMNLSNLIELDDNESRFFVQDATNGEVIYKGIRPFRGLITVLVGSANSGVPNADYRISVQKNDDVPVFATAGYMPLSLQGQGDMVSLAFPVTLQPDDRFRPKIAGDGSATNLIVAHGIISAS